MLELESVTKKFRNGVTAVADLSLAMKSGVLGLLGPNGAGKTTLMQMIATVTSPTSGRIRYDGVDLAADPDHLRRRLGYLPQDFGVYDNLTALEFLTYFASLKGVRSRTRIAEMLELVNLHTVAHRAAGSFSGGMKQRLGIAQALVNDPDVVIVDEPTAGLDPEERVRFRNILSDIGHGKLVILSTHIVTDVESIATTIAVMQPGAPRRVRAARGAAPPRERERLGGGALLGALRGRARPLPHLERGAAPRRRARAHRAGHAPLRRRGARRARVSRTPSSTRWARPSPRPREHGRVAPPHRRRRARRSHRAPRGVRAPSRSSSSSATMAYAMVPAPSTGRTLMTRAGQRALYNSATIAVATSALAALLLGLLGYYLISSAIRRDVITRVGSVIAAMPVRSAEYLAGKLIGNAAFLGFVSAGYMLNVMGMHLLRGEAPLQPLVYLATYTAMLAPAILVFSAIALVFECVRPLSGRVGDVLYFFVWTFMLAATAAAETAAGCRLAGDARCHRAPLHAATGDRGRLDPRHRDRREPVRPECCRSGSSAASSGPGRLVAVARRAGAARAPALRHRPARLPSLRSGTGEGERPAGAAQPGSRALNRALKPAARLLLPVVGAGIRTRADHDQRELADLRARAAHLRSGRRSSRRGACSSPLASDAIGAYSRWRSSASSSRSPTIATRDAEAGVRALLYSMPGVKRARVRAHFLSAGVDRAHASWPCRCSGSSLADPGARALATRRQRVRRRSGSGGGDVHRGPQGVRRRLPALLLPGDDRSRHSGLRLRRLERRRHRRRAPRLRHRGRPRCGAGGAQGTAGARRRPDASSALEQPGPGRCTFWTGRAVRPDRPPDRDHAHRFAPSPQRRSARRRGPRPPRPGAAPVSRRPEERPGGHLLRHARRRSVPLARDHRRATRRAPGSPPRTSSPSTISQAIPQRRAIFNRLEQLWDFPRSGVPVRRQNLYFYSFNSGLQDQPVIYVERVSNHEKRVAPRSEQVLRRRGRRRSRTGRRAATRGSSRYAVSVKGSDWQEIRVRDVESGKDLADTLHWAKFTGIAWTNGQPRLLLRALRGRGRGRFAAHAEQGAEALLPLARQAAVERRADLGAPRPARVVRRRRGERRRRSSASSRSPRGRARTTGCTTSTSTTRGSPKVRQPVVKLMDRFEAKYTFIDNAARLLLHPHRQQRAARARRAGRHQRGAPRAAAGADPGERRQDRERAR